MARVLFNSGELADIYALRTLYDYVASQSLDVQLVFDGGGRHGHLSTRQEEVLRGVPISDSGRADLRVSTISDIRSGGRAGDLLVDIAILKNCAVPLSEEEKRALRAKYSVPSDLPVVVVGFAYPSSELSDLVGSLQDRARIYLVGHADAPGSANENVVVVAKHGVLKDYYALADAAVNAENLRHTSRPLHNFVEATEGGPLFMVPSDCAQYGYLQLVRAGVIRECYSFKGLLEQLSAYLRNPDRATHVERRSAHVAITRHAYLPVILSHIRNLLGQGQPLPSDLIVESGNFGTRLMHPDSRWPVPAAEENELLKNKGFLESVHVEKSYGPKSWSVKPPRLRYSDVFFPRITDFDLPGKPYNLPAYLHHSSTVERLLKSFIDKKDESEFIKPKWPFNPLKPKFEFKKHILDKDEPDSVIRELSAWLTTPDDFGESNRRQGSYMPLPEFSVPHPGDKMIKENFLPDYSSSSGLLFANRFKIPIPQSKQENRSHLERKVRETALELGFKF